MTKSLNSRESSFISRTEQFGNKCGYLGQVARKPVNTNPGLKVNRIYNFSSIKKLSTAYVLCSLRFIMLKTEGQKR